MNQLKPREFSWFYRRPLPEPGVVGEETLPTRYPSIEPRERRRVRRALGVSPGISSLNLRLTPQARRWRWLAPPFGFP